MSPKLLTLPCIEMNDYEFQKVHERIGYQDLTTKHNVDRIKELINPVKRHIWSRAVKFTNPYEKVVGKTTKKISRAYYKILEILKDFDLEYQQYDKITTLHLCEGPGGFVQAIVELCNKQNKLLNWTGITLKNNIDPNLPDFVSDIDLNNVTYGEDGTGDLTNVDNIKFLGKQFQKNGMAHLITADGGFDVSNDHCSQEKQSYILLLCQVVSALECQAFDGAFIMKVFDCYSNEMTELLYILSIHYTEVHITKPFSSRPCNSEKYIVCKGFKGITQKERIALRFLVENSENIRLKEQPSQLFINTLSNINQVFSESQIAALRSTLDYATNTKWVQKPVDMSNWFINRYSIN